MTLFAAKVRGQIFLLTLVLAAGCAPPPGAGNADQGARYLAAGKSRVQRQDFEGARAAFEQALQNSPNLPEAHHELAMLFDNESQLNSPAKALYHYLRVLEIQPDFRWSDMITNRLNAVKMRLAYDSHPRIPSPAIEHEISRLENDLARLSAELKRLTAENTELKTRLALSAVSNPATPAFQTTRQAPEAVVQQPVQAATPVRAEVRTPEPPAARGYVTYQFQKNDTLYSLGRRHGVDWKEIQAANPDLDARSIQPGTIIRIPVK
ncbi:MAG TPA: hypothetical protein DCY13_11020 [Verrucomicrobiales bacterium]|nr:hypothetical protein [Verrucomicrobiales bacterium]